MTVVTPIARRWNELWKRLHSEVSDPLEEPEWVRRWVYELRDQFCAPFIMGKDVLELGCGYGYSAFLFSKHAKSVVGVDINEKAIARARQRYQNKANISFVCGDCFDFLDKAEREGHTYDVVALFEFLEHVEVAKQEELLRRVFNVLRRAGRVFLSTPNGRLVPFYRKNPYHTRELSPTELVPLLSQSGFQVEEVKGQVPLFWFLLPVPWSWYSWAWGRLGISGRVYRLRENAQWSRTILVRAVKV